MIISQIRKQGLFILSLVSAAWTNHAVADEGDYLEFLLDKDRKVLECSEHGEMRFLSNIGSVEKAPCPYIGKDILESVPLNNEDRAQLKKNFKWISQTPSGPVELRNMHTIVPYSLNIAGKKECFEASITKVNEDNFHVFVWPEICP